MHSKLRITCPANTGDWGITSPRGMRIEIHFSRAPYVTSLRSARRRLLTYIASIAIESLGVTNYTKTFLCSRQVPKPNVVAYHAFVSVNEFCEKTTSLLKAPQTHQFNFDIKHMSYTLYIVLMVTSYTNHSPLRHCYHRSHCFHHILS